MFSVKCSATKIANLKLISVRLILRTELLAWSSGYEWHLAIGEGLAATAHHYLCFAPPQKI